MYKLMKVTFSNQEQSCQDFDDIQTKTSIYITSILIHSRAKKEGDYLRWEAWNVGNFFSMSLKWHTQS